MIEKSSPELNRCLCDCSYYIMKGNDKIASPNKRKLGKHKTKLRQLSNKQVSLKKKQKIVRTGGFLSVLLSALAPVLGGNACNVNSMKKLIALEPEVYHSLTTKTSHEKPEKEILSELDTKMQEILNSDLPAAEKMQLYNKALQKSKLFQQKTQAKPK